jgi:anti-sigma factor (TIGR02949 family)
MTDCRDVEPLMTPYVDGEATGGDRARVDEHLAACPPCRRRASDERAARQLVRAHAGTLAERAPLDLRGRCARAIRQTSAPPPLAHLRLWRRVPLPAAAAVLLAVAGLVAWMAASSTPVFAAELALDHLKCFSLFEPATPPASPEHLAADLNTAYGWRITVPAGSPDHQLRLLGARRCFSTDGRVAHILYRHNGRPLSLFLVPDSDRAAASVALAGYEAVIWSKDHMTYVVLSREPAPELSRVASYLRAALD